MDIEPHPRVNLLIGPNSSGKSNFLEALQFGGYQNEFEYFDDLYDSVWRNANKSLKNRSIRIRQELYVEFDFENYSDHSIFSVLEAISFNYKFNTLEIDFESFEDIDESKQINIESINWEKGKSPTFSVRKEWTNETLLGIIKDSIPKSIRIFRPNVIPLKNDQILRKFERLSWDLSELPVLINSMQNAFPENYKKLCDDLFEFTQDFKLVTSPSSGREGFITLNFFNSQMTSFSVNEVSEGILLFTAILAILHQPNPPKVILLEEPENGIHPRRIVEIYRLITKLAQEKNVQFFITTHSPILLNQFSQDPECVWVFDKEDGISKIQNLHHDILEPRRKKLLEMGIEDPSDLTNDLGENWLLGLIDGVPPSILPDDF